ncbi:MAG TPA: DUF2206 domain-containing protein [Candidatus Saccharimonadia bacterium]|nr:DUF2206 domain-containing protein [Candidatus Saccharimonadia bacterium]
MTPPPGISARATVIGLSSWLVVANLCIWLAQLGWWPAQVAALACLSFLPGLALLRLMRVAPRNSIVGVLYSFGLSILVVMLSGLAANQLLPLVGVARPLELWGSLGAWNAVTALLIAVGTATNRRPVQLRRWPVRALSGPDWLLAALSLLLPVGAMFGAFHLNNGGGAVMAELTLGYAAGLMAAALILRRRLSNELLAWLIFVIGLSVLLMTSLRGWDIVGHDIEREFRVYTLTAMHGRWDIGFDRDPYNACLSITILPQMLTKLLNISGLVAFKVVLQLIFAACPVVIFMLLRRYVSKLGALIGSLVFISYPTFINDSAMLTRQGVAYLFFALTLLVISNKTQRPAYKLLALLCALGAILSHYSTAYMFVALFIVAVACKLIVTRWQRRGPGAPLPRGPGTVVSPLFAGVLFAMTFVWYTQVTATSSGLVVTLHTSLANIPKLFSTDNKSSDTSTALLFGGGRDQADLYQAFVTSAQGSRAVDAVVATRYGPTLTSDDLPYTALGLKARSLGLNPALITTLRQNVAKVLQLLALAGVVYAVYRLLRRRPDTLSIDVICLSVAGFVLLALMVVLPVLSVNYGILRAFQQTLIFLVVPIMLLLARLVRPLWNWLKTTVATLGMMGLFLLFTGLFAQLLGGTSPALSMNNQGLYYGLYYAPAADARSFAWLKAHIARGSDVRAANVNRALMHDPEYPFARTGILPSQLGDKTYVYLDQAQVQAQRLYAYYDSSPLIMTFPLDYYVAAKNQIYSTPTTRVYR